VFLLVIGLIVVYAISPGLSAQKDVGENYFVTKQLTAIGLGVLAFVVMASIPLGHWRHLQRPLLIAAAVATLISLVMPVSAEYPAHRWIRFGGISLQSVELVKLALIICLAAFLEQRARQGLLKSTEKTLKPLLIALGGISAVVAVTQRDLGSTAVIVAMMAAMAFVAGLPLRRVVQVSAVVFVGLMLLILPFGYRRDRITTFMNPERDCQAAGYQACQALIAVGSGGLFGKGLANSGQAYGYLPEAANDSIFAIIAEKFGFVGSALLICLFGAFFARIKNIMERAPDQFSRLIVAGILAWLTTQAFINIGAMLALLPLKGITLPFISYGGTSVVFVTAAIGVVFNISRYTTYTINEGKTYEDPAFGRRDRRPYYASTSRRP
jgi:cell division protein FtsW